MTNEELERLEALAVAARDFHDWSARIKESSEDAMRKLLQLATIDQPTTILSLIQRVKEAGAVCDSYAAENQYIYDRGYAAGRAEALEEAAKVAEQTAGPQIEFEGDYQRACRELAADIRALGEKAG